MVAAMKILQLANGYLDKRLYANLFSHMDPAVAENLVFVPVKKGDTRTTGDPGVQIAPCFSELDRKLFYPKQAKTLSAVRKLYGDQLGEIALTHSHTLFSTGYTSLQMKRKYGIPYIAAVRNTDVNKFFAKHPVFRSLGNRIMLEAEKVIFLSSGYADEVLDKYVSKENLSRIREKTEVIPNGISDFFFEQAPREPKKLSPDAIRIIHVGDINRNKNVLTTLAAAEALRAGGKNVTYTLVGEVKDENARAALEGKPYVRLLPKCGHEDVIRYYREADILVVPSRHETFGLVYAEAMSQGLPVIYTRGQGFDGQFPDGEIGYAVDPDDVSGIADRVARIAGRYEELSRNCLEGSRRFVWETISRWYTDLYQKSAGRE